MIFFNRYFDKNRLKALVLWSLNQAGEKKTIDLIEKLKDLGFQYATQAGLSLSIDDLKIPPTKAELILEAENIVQFSQLYYKIGNLTILERYQQMIDTWHRTSELLKQNVIHHFRSTNILNPVYMMAFSGARGNISQVRQLVGMRGLMADPQGQILDFPIRSNFREGLTLTEYVISCYGARKGLVDTALRTANSGYLTRRLVDVAQHIIIRQFDCGTMNSILVTDMKDGKKIILPVQKRIIGRVLAETIVPVAAKNQEISTKLATKIVKLKTTILVKSPLTCEAKNSVCQLCYGWSLAHGNLVSLGEGVGILAAQSIGEPGTQLTMRTFHTGGVFSGDIMQEIRSPINGNIFFSAPLQGNLIRTLHGKIAFLSKIEGEFSILKTILPATIQKNEKKKFYQLPVSSLLFVRHSEKVVQKQLLVQFSSFITTRNQEIQAKYNLNSEKEGQIYFERVLLAVKYTKEGDMIKTALKFGSIWILAGKLCESPVRSTLFTKPGDLIDTNSIFNEFVLATPYTGFLELLKKEKKKEMFLKKTRLSKESFLDSDINFLGQLLMNKKNITNQEKKFPIKKKKIELQFKQPFNHYFFKNIQYKNFGYFFSIKNLNEIIFFYSNSISNQLIDNNQFYLQIFQKKILKSSRIFYYNKKQKTKIKSQYFFYSIKLYQIEKNIENNLKKKVSRLVYNKKENNFLTIKNLQGNTYKIKSEKNQLILIKFYTFEKKYIKDLNQNSSKDLLRKSYFDRPSAKLSCFFLNKKIFFFKENPYRNKNLIFKNKKNSLLRKIKFNPFYTKSFIPISNLEKKNQIRKKSKIFQKKRSERNLYKKSYKIVNIEFNFGCIIFLKNNLNFLFSTNRLFKPGNTKILYYCNQIYSSLNVIEINSFFNFFTKTNFLKKIRYINNKFIRIAKTDKKFLYLKKKKNAPNGAKVATLSTCKKIIRNKLFLQINFSKIKFIKFTKKLKKLNSKDEIKKNKLLQKISNTLYLLNFYNNNLFFFNKQKITKLKPPYKSINLQIRKKATDNQSFFVFIELPKFNFVKKIKITILIPRGLEMSLIQKITTNNFLVPNYFDNEKILVTKKQAIFEQTLFCFNSFSSFFGGEIASIKQDFFRKRKSLLLTNKNQISFFNEKEKFLAKIGQVVRSGDTVSLKRAVQESGQIIEIDKKKFTLRKAQPVFFSSRGIFHINNGELVEKDSPLMTLFYQKLKTEDIVQGIPKIEELFEARQTKEGKILQKNIHTKLYFFFNYYKQQFSSQKAVRKSIKKIQQLLINNVQKVYQSQGVTIADKHIEIIVRQMTTKVKITESGKTGLLRGELIDLEKVELINLGIELLNETLQEEMGFGKAEYEPILLGITKVALETESFISAASFQETTRILSRAAIERKTDFLRGLKENVILGHLIPAGTGFKCFFEPLRTERFIKVSKPLQSKFYCFSYKEIVKKLLKQKK